MTPDADIVIDAAWAASILEPFMDVGNRFVAVNKALNEVDLLRLTCVRKRIIGFGGFMPEDVRNVMRLMERDDGNLEPLITRAFLPTSCRRLWRSPRIPVAR